MHHQRKLSLVVFALIGVFVAADAYGGAGIPVQVAVEESMACGIGVCMTCVLPVIGDDGETRMARSCVEGPVFAGDRIRWDALGTVPADAVGAAAMGALATYGQSSPSIPARFCDASEHQLSRRVARHRSRDRRPGHRNLQQYFGATRVGERRSRTRLPGQAAGLRLLHRTPCGTPEDGLDQGVHQLGPGGRLARSTASRPTSGPITTDANDDKSRLPLYPFHGPRRMGPGSRPGRRKGSRRF